MKNQASFSLKDKSKKLKCPLLQFLLGAVRVNDVNKFLLSLVSRGARMQRNKVMS